MTSQMHNPRVVAYAVATGRILTECGDHTAWMTADDLDRIADAWHQLAVELRDRNLAVDAIVGQT